MTVASPYSQQVASEIRAQMARQNKGIAGLARTIGRSAPTASDRYHGRTPYNFDELMAVCAWLGVTLAHLHADEEVISDAS